MTENRLHCLVIVITVFLPQRSDSIDQDYTNPASSNIHLDNFAIAKTLADAAELDDKYNETESFGSGPVNELVNVSGEPGTTAVDETVTNKQVNSSPLRAADPVPTPDVEKDEKKVVEDKIESNDAFSKNHDQSKSNSAGELADAFKILEKRDTDNTGNPRAINLTLHSNEKGTNIMQSESYQYGQAYQGSNKLPSKGYTENGSSPRRFRDVYEDLGNGQTAEEKLQPEPSSLFMKNSAPLVVKSKSRCSSCEDRMQKVVPDGNSFIELGSDHEEDDTIRKFQGMIFLIDSIIETAGSCTRKELGLCRKSKLADAACLLTNEEEKMEKIVLQIVSCVKDAMKDQMTMKCCIPLPRELHSFLIWLMHGSEGGGMCPPTVQESKSKPSYLFHEDNHRPHIVGGVYGTPPCPSGSLMELISSNKALPGQVGNVMSPHLLSPQSQEQSDALMNLRPQYEIESSQSNNLNNQFMGDQQKNELPYQRKTTFTGRNYYRPLRSLSEVNGRQLDNDIEKHEQANMAIRDPMEELMTYPEGSDPLYPNESEYERQSRNTDEFSTALLKQKTECADNENPGKTIAKRDLSRRKIVGNKNREDHVDAKNIQRKKKRRDGITKLKQGLQDLVFESTSSTECSIDVQALLQPNCWNAEKKFFSKDRKDKRKERKKSKCVNRKVCQTMDNISKYNQISDTVSPKEEKTANEESKKDQDSLKLSSSSDSSEMNSKSIFDDLLMKDESSDAELDSSSSDGKLQENKKKKKHRNSKMSLTKDKHVRAMTTEPAIHTGTVSMNLSELLPCVDLTSGRRSKTPHRRDNGTNSKCFQVTFSSAKCKQNKLKPSIVFEDDFNKDSSLDTEDDEYPEAEYSLNDLEEYEQNYLDEDNEPIDLYYDSKSLQTSKLKSDDSIAKEIRKKSRETRFKNKKDQHSRKTVSMKKKRKQTFNKSNEKSQTNMLSTSKTDIFQWKGSSVIETATSATRRNVEIGNKESATEIVLNTLSSTYSSKYESPGDGQNSKDRTNNGLKQEAGSKAVGHISKQDKETKADTTTEEKKTTSSNVDKNNLKAETHDISVDSKALATAIKDVQPITKEVKNRVSSQDSYKSPEQKKQELKKKNKAVLKDLREPFEKSGFKVGSSSRSRVLAGGKKSQVLQDQVAEDQCVSLDVRHKAKSEEDEENDDDDSQSTVNDTEDTEDETDAELEDDSLTDVKLKNQMWMDEDRPQIDPETLSNIEVAPNSDNIIENYAPKLIKINQARSYHAKGKKQPIPEDVIIKILSSPANLLSTGGFEKERDDGLFNVTNFKGVRLIGEASDQYEACSTSSPSSKVAPKAGLEGPMRYEPEERKIESRLTEPSMIKLSTAGTKASEATGATLTTSRSSVKTFTSTSAQLVAAPAEAAYNEKSNPRISDTASQQTTPKNSKDIKREIFNIPLARISCPNPLQTLFQ